MISKRVQRSTQWLVHGSPSGSIGLPEAAHQVVFKRAILVIHRESTVPTVEVVLQLQLSAFTCRTDEAIVSSSQNRKHCDSGALIHLQTDAIKRCPSVHLPAEAKASRHHHGCLCGTSCVHTQNNLKLAARESGTLFGLGRLRRRRARE